MRSGHLVNLGPTPYVEAWELQRSIAAAVLEGSRPDTVVFLEHPPVITIGRRTGEDELHVPAGADVDVVETDRGGKSTYHGPGQLVCYPIFDLNRHGRDVRRYCRDLEEAVVRTLAGFGLDGTRIDGLTGVWLEASGTSGAPSASATRGDSASSTAPREERSDRRERSAEPRKIASIGVHISRWVTTHGYALNVDPDLEPFTGWITACGLEDAAFTSMTRELGRAVTVDEVRPVAAAAIADVFDLTLEESEVERLAGPTARA